MGPALLEMAEQGDCREIVLDLYRVERLTSAVLARIVCLQRKLEARGTGLRLVNVGAHVRETLRVTRLDQILDIAASPSDP
jgi:anti-anti-sigma factor